MIATAPFLWRLRLRFRLLLRLFRRVLAPIRATVLFRLGRLRDRDFLRPFTDLRRVRDFLLVVELIRAREPLRDLRRPPRDFERFRYLTAARLVMVSALANPVIA